mmetsp:Transcript_19964/g.18134  ORF Transcript_19964/g.18134 Transcript_19964/m.18134 type:complete len:149 (+) Transcript_19964:84-530(+)
MKSTTINRYKGKSKLNKHVKLDSEHKELDDDNNSELSDNQVDENEIEQKVDRFATTLQQILQQNVDNKIPVLSKRKTDYMTMIEQQREESERIKRLKLEHKSDREKQSITPDFSSAIKERQLKKLATRGVIALFNAIAKAKRESSNDQ